MTLAIQIHNLSKKYNLHQQHFGQEQLREKITRFLSFKNLQTKNLQTKKLQTKSIFWALQNLNLTINKGEAVGIIGKNGAGKSTLLKILSRITAPTSGKIQLYAKVASLLEVGTGFHAELTGRENIYLNGSILGMSRREIKRQFDNIVQFSELEQFIDVPIKRYSSGMYMRLAFSVAAHLRQEILLVDEILAVGDYKFQQQCLGKLDEITKEGRTILFVSHDLAAVKNLCRRTIILQKTSNSAQQQQTSLSFDGPTEQAIEHYLQAEEQQDTKEYQAADESPTFHLKNTSKSFRFLMGQTIHLSLTLKIPYPIQKAYYALMLHRKSGETLACSHGRSYLKGQNLSTGEHSIEMNIPNMQLFEGEYFFTFVLADQEQELASWNRFFRVKIENAILKHHHNFAVRADQAPLFFAYNIKNAE